MNRFTLFLFFVFTASAVTAAPNTTRYPLGSGSEFSIQIDQKQNDSLEFVSNGTNKLFSLNAALVFYEEQGFPPKAVFGRKVANRISKTTLAAATIDWLELQVTIDNQTSSAIANRNYQLNYSVYLSKKWPIAVLRLNSITNLDSIGVRLEAYSWLFSFPKDKQTLSENKQRIRYQQDQIYCDIFYLKSGKTLIKTNKETSAEFTILPPELFYLEPGENWEGFGPYICIIFHDNKTQLQVDEQELTEKANAFVKDVTR